MIPAVGDSVHYVSHGTPVREDGSQAFTSQCRAAIITEVYGTQAYDEHGNPVGPRTCPDDGQHVNLAVLNPTGMFFNQAVPFEDARGLVYEGDADAGPEPVRRTGGTWHWRGHE